MGTMKRDRSGWSTVVAITASDTSLVRIRRQTVTTSEPDDPSF
jgi:hypothetical protein